MTIYEIDQAIMECVDFETGEIIDTAIKLAQVLDVADIKFFVTE